MPATSFFLLSLLSGQAAALQLTRGGTAASAPASPTRRSFLGSSFTAAAAAAAAAAGTLPFGAQPAQAVATNAGYGTSANFAVVTEAPSKNSGPSVYDSALSGSLGDAKREKALAVLKAEYLKVDALAKKIGLSVFENDIGISASKVLPAMKTVNPDSARYAAVKAHVQSATFSSQKNRLEKAKSELDEFGSEIKEFLKEQGVVDVQVAVAAPTTEAPSSDSGGGQ